MSMIRVAIAIIKKNGDILIAKRTKDDPLKGKWEFPGGKVETGETPEECLKREVHEELGIEITVEELICSSEFEYSHMSVDLLAYKASHISGEIQPKVYSEIEWIPPSEIEQFEFPEANRPIIEKIKSY